MYPNQINRQISFFMKKYLQSGGDQKYKLKQFIKNEGDFQNLKFDFEQMKEVESFGKINHKKIKQIFEKNCVFDETKQ